MGSHEFDTPRANPGGMGSKKEHGTADIAESEEVKLLKTKYPDSLLTLRELFVSWTDEDLLFALKEAEGDLELTVARISEGHANQWGEVKSKKHKKEAKTTGQQHGTTQRASRAGHSDRGSERGRSRDGSNYRGGKFPLVDRERRQGSQRRENGSGYNKPPRQQNGPGNSQVENHNNSSGRSAQSWDKADNTTTDRTSTSGTLNNNASETTWNSDNANWASDDAKGWSTENVTDTAKGARENDKTTSGFSSGALAKAASDNENISASTTTTSNGVISDHVNDNFGSNSATTGRIEIPNDNREADTNKETWNSDSNWGDGKLTENTAQSPRQSVNKSISKSPVPSRTIPAQSKASWAQIVKPELKPETIVPNKSSPEISKAVSPRLPKSASAPSPSTPKTFETSTESAIAPSISPLEPVTPIPITEAPKVEETLKEFVKEASPSENSIASSPIASVSPRTKEISPPGLNKTKTPTIGRKLRHDAPVIMPSAGAGLERVGVLFGSLNLSSPTEEKTETEISAAAPIFQKVEEKSPLISEASQTTPLQSQQQLPQQSTPQPQQQVAAQQSQPSTAVQTQQHTAASTQVQQHTVAAVVQAQQQQQQQIVAAAQAHQTAAVLAAAQAQQQQHVQQATTGLNNVNRIPVTSSNQNSISSINSTPSANVPNPTPGIATYNPSYFKQQDQTSTATAYVGQQPHLGLGEPYASYLPNQPPNQISGFGIGPMQSLPEYGGAALYGPDAQRMMAYYTADPAAYGQASPVTSNAYQTRDNKYTPETNSTSASQPSSQTAASQQANANQQQGQTPQQQQQQQQAYPLGMPYYPYYYMNQFPSAAYQQSGYGQPFVNKSMYPMYNTHAHHHSTKPGSGSAASPYGYPGTPTTPNAPPHHYSHSSTTGYDEVTAAGLHHLPGVPSVHDYQKAYGTTGGIPQLQNFLSNNGVNTNQPGVGSTGSNSTGNKTSSNGTELSSSAQYKGYEKSSSGSVQQGVGQSSGPHQQSGTPNYYGQVQQQQQQQVQQQQQQQQPQAQAQQQQMFNNYPYQPAHHQQYHPQHQTHHQASTRNQQYWSQQS